VQVVTAFIAAVSGNSGYRVRWRVSVAIGVEVASEGTVALGEIGVAGLVGYIAHVIERTGVGIEDRNRAS